MRKLLSLVMAMMMFAVPSLAELGVIGGADGPTSMLVSETFLTGEQLMQDAIDAGRRVTMNMTIPECPTFSDDETGRAVADLINVLGLHASLQGDEYSAAVALSGKDVLTLGWALNGNNLYLNSNLLGDTVVVADTEIEPLAGRLLDMMVLMGAMEEDEAEEVKASIPVLIESIKEAIEQSYGMTVTEENLQSFDFSALEDAWNVILQDVEDVQEPIVPRMCDAATRGIRLSMDDMEFKNLVKSCILFVKENPRFASSLEAQGLFPTEESRAAEWENYGSFYMRWGYYEDEAAYNAANPTFSEMLDQAIAELDNETLLGDEFVTNICFNEADEIVYLSSALPMYVEHRSVFDAYPGNASVQSTTEVLNVVYTRQTVAQGVSHVCNITMDGEGAAIDVLERENAWTFRLGDIASQTTMLTVNVAEKDGVISGDFDTHGEGLTGTFSFCHEADEAHLKTELAVTLSINEEEKPNETPMSLFFEYAALYARNGVDFTGKETIAAGYNDMKFVVNMDIVTEDPVDSIMSGNVIRPAELDDNAFVNWFVSLYTTMVGALGNLITVLPESVLMLAIESGMLF